MTNRYLLHWLQAAWWVKVASLLLAVLILAVAEWLLWLGPAWQQSQQLAQQQQQASLHYQQQLQQLYPLPALSRLLTEVMQLQAAHETARPFSLATLLGGNGAELQHWQPSAAGGELALALHWPQFILLLDELLSVRPAVAITQLSLLGQAQALHLKLALTLTEDATEADPPGHNGLTP